MDTRKATDGTGRARWWCWVSVVALAMPVACGAATPDADSAARSHTLEVDSPSTAGLGEPVVCVLRLRARGPYHVTQDYPVELHVRGSEASIPREWHLERDELEVVSREAIVANVPVRFTAIGVQRLTARFELSLCTDERCEVMTATRSWTIEVR